MPKVGRFVTDPRAGAYCRMTLDSGEKVIVNHEKGGRVQPRQPGGPERARLAD
jgi:hypothetical protein